jgi:hypothetical protein
MHLARALPTKKGHERVNVRTQAREPRSARTESSDREVGWGGMWGEGGAGGRGARGGRRGKVAGADLRSKLLDALVCVRQFFSGLVQARPQLAVLSCGENRSDGCHGGAAPGRHWRISRLRQANRSSSVLIFSSSGTIFCIMWWQYPMDRVANPRLPKSAGVDGAEWGGLQPPAPKS